MKQLFLNLKKLWKYSKDQKIKILIYLFTHIFSIIIGIVLPIASARLIINLTNNNLEQLIYMALIIYVIEMSRNVLFYIQRSTTQQIFKNSYVNIQTVLGSEILKLENDVLDKQGSGVFLQRINSDTYRLSDMFNALILFLSRILQEVGVFVAIFIISKLMFFFLIFTTMINFIINYIRSDRYNKKDKECRKMEEKNSSFITEMVRGARDVKMLNAEDSFLNKYKEKVDTTNNYRYAMETVDRVWSFFQGMISDTSSLLLIVILVYLIKNHGLAVANALILYNYSSKIEGVIYNVSFFIDKVKSFNLSCDRVFGVIDSDEFKKEKFGKKHLKKVEGNFEFRDVVFNYNNKKEVLNGINFKIKANETVAFVGKSGAGKTTIFSLLTKMYEPSNGEILIDGVNIKNLDKDSIRGNITIISQNPYIFNLSIRENLTLVKNDLTEEEMSEACRVACLDEFIESLPDGYDTIVGEGGVTLSGGQKQRLAIARALIQKTEIILFDEATSSLDNETQSKIQEAIDNMKNEYTILIIAHRLSTIINSDRILFLEDGVIKAEGTHKELLKKCSGYKKNYESEIKK